jgi:hypothetical protein
MKLGRVVLLGTVFLTAGVVKAVHSSQQAERARMFEGVVRDMERQNLRKTRY